MKTLRMIPFLIFVVLAAFLGRGLWLDPKNLPSVQLGKPLPAFQIPQLLDPNQSFQSSHFQKTVVLLNVWASWCSACVEEQVLLLELASQGIPIYGLNYQDSPKEAKKWLEQWGNPYRLIGQDSTGEVAMDLGVYGAPEIFLIDKEGMIRYRHVGILTKTIWEEKLLPLKRQLDNA
jgi:cytochrome c biogenesis protein CcmG, thiol:disulfide interchange protein DsbE